MNKHKKLLKEHKGLLRFCDIMTALVILFNVGAMVITNMMVVKVEPTVEFTETNPVAVEIHNYKPSEPNFFKAITNFLLGFVKQAVLYGVLVCGYLLLRSTLTEKSDLKHLIGLIVIWLAFIGLDFFSNFGYLLGKIIYGG